jgi:hypothetical protein
MPSPSLLGRYLGRLAVPHAKDFDLKNSLSRDEAIMPRVDGSMVSNGSRSTNVVREKSLNVSSI